MLACTLEATAIPGGAIRLGFELANDGAEPITVTRYEPFAGFALKVRVAGAEVPLSRPPSSIPVEPVEERIEPGQRLRLPTAVELSFDPDALVSPGGNWNRWRIVHDPAPVELEATLLLEPEAIGPCTAWVDPTNT